jgi:protein-tyrosine phosphatase
VAPTLYTVDLPGPGRISVLARPDGGTRLDDELASLANRGVTVLVSALTPDEARRLDLTGEAAAAARAGLSFVSLPIPDFGVPDPEEFLPALRDLAGDLRRGAHIAVHCFAGIGRSPTLAAAVLVLAGSDPATAWDALEHARGLPVPNTPAQRAWPARLASVPRG